MTDQEAFDELRDSIWYELACRCRECGDELELEDLERLRDRDAMAWSRIAAERAIEDGWRPEPGVIGVVCPQCLRRRN
jgi:hypothetical protein